MVKLIFLCRRRPDITHARYRELLLHGHVPLALRHHPTLQQYAVNIVEQVRTGEQPLDSIGELWFATLADFRERLYDSDAGRRIIEADVAQFMGSADAYATTAHVHKPAPLPAQLGERTPGVKLMCALRRRPDLTHAQFVEHWLTRHAPLVFAHHPGLAGYTANIVSAALSPAAPEIDGIAELHFNADADLRDGMFDSPDGERRVREDIARFIAEVRAYHVAEYVEKIAG